jgi:hypothetical protein
MISFNLIRSIGWIPAIVLMFSLRSFSRLPLTEVFNQLNKLGNVGTLLKTLITQNSIIMNNWNQCIENNAFVKVFNWLIFVSCFGGFSSIFRWLSKTFFIVILTSAGVMFIQ